MIYGIPTGDYNNVALCVKTWQKATQNNLWQPDGLYYDENCLMWDKQRLRNMLFGCMTRKDIDGTVKMKIAKFFM